MSIFHCLERMLVRLFGFMFIFPQKFSSVLCVALVALLMPLGAMAAGEEVSLDSGWQYRWGDSPFTADGVPVWSLEGADHGEWGAIDFPSNPPGRDGQNNVWYRTTLPGGDWRDPVLYIFSVDLITEVYMDGQQIYHYGTFDENGQGQFEGWPWHMIDLPDGFAGKPIYFRVYSSYSDIGLWGEVKLMERLSLLRDIVERSMEDIVISGLSMLIALLTLVFAASQSHRRTYLMIALFTFASSIMLFAQTPVKQLIFNAPLMWNHIGATGYFLIPIAMALLFGTWYQGKNTKLVTLIWQVHCVFVVIAIGGSVGGYLELSTMYLVFDGLLTISLGILFMIAFTQFKEVQNEVKIVTATFAVFSLFLLADMAVAHNILPWTTLPISWGLLLFSTTMVAISLRHFALLQGALQDMNVNLEHMVAERTKELTESEALVRSMYLDTPIMLHSIDTDGRLLAVSKYWLQSMGYEEDEVIGRRSSEFLTEQSRQYAQDVILPDFFKTGQLRNVEYQFVRKDGSVFDGQLSAILERDNDGRPLRSLAVTVDVTERKNAEKNLRLAKAEAERASMAKTKFLASASHDLRQPLQAAHLFLYALSQKEHQPESREIISHIEASVEALDALLNSLLDLSLLEAKLVQPDIKVFPLSDLLNRLAAEYRHITWDVRATFSYVESRAHVESDPVLLERIVRNFLSNAVKHVQQGRVLLGCRRHGKTLSLEVWDNGCGIPEDRRHDIFEEFTQIGNEGRDRSKGLGLGLSIVSKLGNLLGHAVTVRSWEGRGSVFAIDLPVVPAAAVATSVEGDVIDAPSGSTSVLVIDDEPAIREGLGLILRQRGFEVHTVSGFEGESSLKTISGMTAPPDIIIADFRLQHGKTGLEAIAAIQETFKTKIPAVLVTGDTAPERLVEAISGGFLILHKPVTAEDLFRAIAETLKKR